ncbi:MAG TPA: hypothetical protein VKZ79_05810 [Alphaproteobacteria bacterium]|nr:hypothetical protein [Alphaproteobacteria bacterium]
MHSLGSGRPTRNNGAGSAFVLAVSGRTGGVLLREGKGFRFNASDPAMRRLDGVYFASLAEAEAAVELMTTNRRGAQGIEASISALF